MAAPSKSLPELKAAILDALLLFGDEISRQRTIAARVNSFFTNHDREIPPILADYFKEVGEDISKLTADMATSEEKIAKLAGEVAQSPDAPESPQTAVLARLEELLSKYQPGTGQPVEEEAAATAPA